MPVMECGGTELVECSCAILGNAASFTMALLRHTGRGDSDDEESRRFGAERDQLFSNARTRAKSAGML